MATIIDRLLTDAANEKERLLKLRNWANEVEDLHARIDSALYDVRRALWVAHEELEKASQGGAT